VKGIVDEAVVQVGHDVDDVDDGGDGLWEGCWVVGESLWLVHGRYPEEVREARWADADQPLADGCWALQVGGPQDRERRSPPLRLARCLWEVHPIAPSRHQSEHVVQQRRWRYVDLLCLRKMVIYSGQSE
jgi:hypothetical protein